MLSQLDVYELCLKNTYKGLKLYKTYEKDNVVDSLKNTYKGLKPRFSHFLRVPATRLKNTYKGLKLISWIWASWIS